MEGLYGSGRLMVMDDEEQFREATRAKPEEPGHTVQCANNGSDTVEIYRQRKEEGLPFSAVIMDLTIPGGTGGKEAGRISPRSTPTSRPSFPAFIPLIP
jgi:CheY-like chemotaxis protein